MASDATRLPIEMSVERGVAVLGLTIMMCAISGLIAVRKLRTADPAEIF
jgi:putative ABC transport system permease protein